MLGLGERANVRAATFRAPADTMEWANSWRVEPVVYTSSTKRMDCRQMRLGLQTRKEPFWFFLRSASVKAL
jgi:hypothetical protein